MAFFIERPIPERPYFKVGEAAHILGVAPSTVRYWQKEFPGHIKAELSRSGQNVFSRCDVIVMAVILNLVRTEGMPIKDARARLTDVINEHGGRIDRIQLCLQFELPLQADAPVPLVIEPVEDSPAAPVVACVGTDVAAVPVSTAPSAPCPAPLPDSAAIDLARAELCEELARVQAELDHQLSVGEFLTGENAHLREVVAGLRADLTRLNETIRDTARAMIADVDRCPF